MWADPTRDLATLPAMRADLDFTCRYDHLFARAEGFAEHVFGVVSRLVEGACSAVHVGPHSASELGLPACEVAFRVLTGLSAKDRRKRIGPGVLRSPDTIPPWLRTTLPPAKFGRLFFTMSEGARLDELPRGRLDEPSLESAVLLGILAGLVERNEELDIPTTAPPDLHHGVLVGESACGGERRLLNTLREVAEQSRRRQKRTRLTGTRFEPVGLEAGGLHSFYAIGEGGFAIVEVATMAGSNELIAVKRLREEHQDKPEILRRFTAEAALLGLIQHPRVTRGFGALRVGSEHFILMELVHGVTLAELLRALSKQGRRLSEPLARHIGAAIADALTCVHELKSPEGRPLRMVHRDIAPPNILLTFSGEVKLADFSTAQGDDPRFAPERRGARSGRLGYMSPESLLTAPTALADEYALGACLYEALSGHKLVEAESQAETLQAVVRGVHTPILEHAPELTPQFAYHLERAIAPMPHDRHACMATFAEALRRGLPDGQERELTLLIDELFGATAARELEALARIRDAIASTVPPPLPGAAS